MLVKIFLTTIFRTKADASVVKRTGNLLAFGIKNSEVAVCIINFEHYVQIMAFVAQVCIIKTDGFGFELATAAVEAVLAVIVSKGYALITLQLFVFLNDIVIAKLVHGVTVAEAIAAVFATFYTHPNAFLIIGFVAQVAHTLHKLVVLHPVGKSQSLGCINCIYAGCRPWICRVKWISRDYLYPFQVPVGIIAVCSTILMIQRVFIPIKRTLLIVGQELALFVLYAYKNSTCSAVSIAICINVVKRNVMVAGVSACDVQTVAVVGISACVDVHVKSAFIPF